MDRSLNKNSKFCKDGVVNQGAYFKKGTPTLLLLKNVGDKNTCIKEWGDRLIVFLKILPSRKIQS